MKVPLVDLSLMHQRYARSIEDALVSVARGGRYILDEKVLEFEDKVAKKCACDRAVAVANGTDALVLALKAVGVGPGHEVICPSMTFVATAHAISRLGARPIFADIDAETYTIDPKSIEDCVTSNTKAIVPVHLYGQPADMKPIMSIAKAIGAAVVEDCAQAMGSQYEGMLVGSIGDAGCFSLFPTKPLGAYGDGGIVTTNRIDVADKIRVLRKQGAEKKNQATELGLNSRLDEIQAAVLLVKLEHLDDDNLDRQRIALKYNESLKCHPGLAPTVARYGTHVYHLYVVDADWRDELFEHLKSEGVGCQVHYDPPVHEQQYYSQRRCFPIRELPATEIAANRILSLPLYPGILPEQQQYVVDLIGGFYEGKSRYGKGKR